MRYFRFSMLVILIFTLILSACGGAAETAAPAAATAPAAEESASDSSGAAGDTASDTVATPAEFQESPMLTELVEAGELPPLEERLPSEPLVVQPFDQIGQHGGTLRFADAQAWNLDSLRKLRINALFRWNSNGTEPVLDIAKSYSWSEDMTTLTIELREGHRWSDGTPLTVDDILFWWEDVQNNPDLSPSGPARFWRPGGELAVFTKVSPTELSIQFATPYPVAMDHLARSLNSGDPTFLMPRHYLEQYHLAYNPDANELAESEGFDNWITAFNNHAAPPNYFLVGRPSLYAWIPELTATDRVVAVRNPYFHQVDPEGNQLPYIDRIEAAIVQDAEIMALKASSGELDLETYSINLSNMSVFKANEAQGNYIAHTIREYRPSAAIFGFNRTVQDEFLAELFGTLDFRIAMSIAINRDAINEAVFFGQAVPNAVTVNRDMSFYKEEWGKAYIEYDPERANQLLDSIGLTEQDSEGYRLRPDNGERISLLAELYWPNESPKEQIAEIVAENWREVGIELVVRVPETSLVLNREQANETQVMVGHLDGTGLFGRAAPRQFAFTNWQGQYWGAQWAIWIQSNGESGIEPPQEIKDMQARFEEYLQTVPGTPEFNELGAAYYEYFAREIPVIGTVGYQLRPMVVSNRLHNVPHENMYWGADTDFYGPFVPSQWFISE